MKSMTKSVNERIEHKKSVHVVCIDYGFHLGSYCVQTGRDLGPNRMFEGPGAGLLFLRIFIC